MSYLIEFTYESELFKSYLMVKRSGNFSSMVWAQLWFGVPVTSVLFDKDTSLIDILGRYFIVEETRDRNPLGENDGRRYYVCAYGCWHRHEISYLRNRCMFYTDGLIQSSS